jgi:hypothetical protein
MSAMRVSVSWVGVRHLLVPGEYLKRQKDRDVRGVEGQLQLQLDEKGYHDRELDVRRGTSESDLGNTLYEKI